MRVGDRIDVPYSRTPIAYNLARVTGFEFTQRRVGDMLRNISRCGNKKGRHMSNVKTKKHSIHTEETKVDNKKTCQNCSFHTQGVGAMAPNGKTPWIWQECSKGWGKPTPVGVLKNLCGAYQPKKES